MANDTVLKTPSARHEFSILPCLLLGGLCGGMERQGVERVAHMAEPRFHIVHGGAAIAMKKGPKAYPRGLGLDCHGTGRGGPLRHDLPQDRPKGGSPQKFPFCFQSPIFSGITKPRR